MAIPDEKIEEVRTTADIVDVAGDYVRLKKSGSRFKGLCPFHDEKTPSFSIDPDQNLFYCFGCQKGGDIFTFLQEIEGLSFLESVRLLAERNGIPLPEDDTDPEEASEVEAIYHALRFAGRFFYRQLTQTNRGTPALNYLRGRGLTPSTIKTFGLGYAPDSWDALLNAAKEEPIEPEVLEKAGLIIARNDGGGHYDRYRDRVVFPIFSHVGKVLGFGGRILDDDADQPKYINSPETRVYHKSRVLYGLRQAKKTIRRKEEAVLVEGYTDVIALHQAGQSHAIASSGTALTEEQVRMLGRYAKRLILLYDGDEAGTRAAVRGMDLVLQQGLGAYVVELPDGHDPDSFVQEHGADAFAEYIDEKRQDMPTFRYRRAQVAGQLETPEDRVEAQRGIMESIAQIEDYNLRREYVRRTSDVLGVPDNDLFRMLDEELQQKETKERRQRTRQQKRAEQRNGAPEEARRAEKAETAEQAPPTQPLPEEKILLRLMLEHGTSMVEFILSNMALDEFTEGPSRRIVKRLIEMYQADDVRPNEILSGKHGTEVQNLAASVMVDEHEPSANWIYKQNISVPRLNQEPYEAGASAMTLLKMDRVNAAIEAKRERVFQVQGDDERVRELQNQMMKLHDLRKRIDRREFLEWTKTA